MGFALPTCTPYCCNFDIVANTRGAILVAFVVIKCVSDGVCKSLCCKQSFIVCISGVVVVLYAATLIFAVFSFILIYVIGNVFRFIATAFAAGRRSCIYGLASATLFMCTGCPVASLTF